MATELSPQIIQELEAALRASNDRRRAGQMQRIIWLSEYDRLPDIIMGRTETLHILREAREVFVDGHFAAALLLAISVINHSLVDELQLRNSIKKNDPGFEAVLKKSEELAVLPSDWFGPLRLLAARRHPFVHFKDPKHEHALGARVRLEQRHPARLLQDDAEVAVMYMYRVFRATLREAA